MLSDLRILGESARLEFGENELPVDADFKAASIGWNEDQPLDARFEFFDELFGQTDRFRFVVSGLAVDDFNFHDYLWFT